jgi:hypothetical protein
MALSIDVGRALPLQQRSDGSFVLSGARVTFGQLQQRSGVPEQALKRWINAGVLEPTKDTRHAGSGNHRVFFEKEVIVAALLAPFSEAGVPLGRLLGISRIFRHALLARRPGFIVDDLDRRYRDLGQAMLRATKDIGTYMVAITITVDDRIHFETFSGDGSFDAVGFLAAAAGSPTSAVTVVNMTDRLAGILD